MCGITGFWNFKADQTNAELLTTAKVMTAQINTRGPDSWGAWCEQTAGVAMGHARLAIVDLTAAGHQPMTSHSGGSVIAYNGEIYNADEIRKDLLAEGCQFRGHSDTEVILEACEAWGVEQACQRFIGMFAFSYWHKQQQRLFLVRDRVGIKPLYWGFNQGVLFFGSQLKSFTGHPKWSPTLDSNALTAYLRFNYVPAPYSIYSGVHKLQPGTILTIDASQQPKELRFWNLVDIAQKQQQRHNLSDGDLTQQLEQLLQDAVQRRMIADVPLGAFLSGGVDSSLVVALMQKVSPKPIKTFTIGFKETDFDESSYAERVAKHLGTDHHCLYLSSQEAQSIIPEIPNWCDEPFADVSQIPTFLVSRLARRFVTVSLSGDGGDELFAGYNRYLFGQNIWQKLRYLPHWLRAAGAKSLMRLAPSTWDKLAHIVPQQIRPNLFGDKVHKLAEIMQAATPEEFYKRIVSQWQNPAQVVKNSKEVAAYPWVNLEQHFAHLAQGGDKNNSLIATMQLLDMLTYLPDDILTKVDRASMAVSLEARVPLLDHRVIEFCWGLPLQMKIRAGESKWLLRQVLYQHVPRALIERPKMGFGVPIGQWLRGPLREWAENLLAADKLEIEGILEPGLIRQKWVEHLSGNRNWQYQLWGILMFQAWRERWL